MRKALAGKPSLEVRWRLEQLLVNVELVNSPDQLRVLRAVEVMEYIGSPKARQILEGLAKGAADARLTQSANDALMRLSRRP